MHPGEQILTLIDGLALVEDRLDGDESLPLPFAPLPFDESRKILRWLRNLDAIESDMDAWMERSGPQAQESKLDYLQRLCRIYLSERDKTRAGRPAPEDNSAVLGADEAVSALTLAAVEQMLESLPDGHPAIPKLKALAEKLEARGSKRRMQSVRRLLEMLEAGLELLSGQFIGERSPVDRLVEMSNRIADAARKLQSIDTLREPAREESIELAREILKHRNISGSDKSMEEMISSGRPADNAAFAQQISDMVELYKNMLVEAAAINPALLMDKRVQDANDTVGTFAYGVSLMAAKEMPGSIAATQQISAGATDMPEQWKNLNGRVADRLRTVNAGLEQAVSAIEHQQEMQQKRAEEATQENAQQQQNDSNKKRGTSGRRGRRFGGGLTKNAARRSAGDLNGDGIADNLQGVNVRGGEQGRNSTGGSSSSGGGGGSPKITAPKALRTDPKVTAPPKPPPKIDQKIIGGAPKLRPEDLAAVQKLGDALRDIGKQAKTLAPPATETAKTGGSVNPAAVGDDRTFVVKNAERDKQQQTRPGQNKPTMGA